MNLGKEPTTVGSMKSVGRIEKVFGLPPGTLISRCSVKRVYMSTERLKIRMSEVNLKRVRGSLPDEFEQRSKAEQREIYEWVMENIVLTPG